MSTLRATNIKNPDSGSNNIVLSAGGGVVISGVATASSFVGNVTGNATGLSGTPNLNVGILTASSFSGSGSGLTGVGKVLQVVQTTLDTTFTTTSQTFAATGMTASITPSSASNKILATFSVLGTAERDGNFNCFLLVDLYRGATKIGPRMTWATINNDGQGLRIYAPGAFSFLDSPATTSQVTYTTQGALFPGGTSTVQSGSTITLMEIAA